MELANPSGTSIDMQTYEQLFNQASMSTSDYVVTCVAIVWSIICRWRMFEKAGLHGWGSLIPFYNIYLRFKMAGMSGWWLLSLLFLPVFAVAFIVSYFKIAKKFGKSGWFGLGLWFLNPIFIFSNLHWRNV